MAAFSETSLAIFFGSTEAEVWTNKLMLEAGCEELDSTTFGTGGNQRVEGGVATATATMEGFQDFAATGLGNLITIANIRGQQPYGIAVPGTAAGDPAFIGTGKLVEAPPLGGSIGQLATTSLKFAGDSPMSRGQLAAPSAARTSTANGTVLTLAGPTASQRVYASLHVMAASGTTPTLDVTVQSATVLGFGSPTTRLTFAQATGAGSPQSQFLSLAGAVTDGFWRCVWTVAGGTPSFTFAVLIGVI